MTPFSGEKPQRGIRATFSALIDPFITWLLDIFWPELQAVVAAFNFNATNSTSTDNLTISPGLKTLNAGANKSFQKSMALTLGYSTDPKQWMRGEVLTYDSSTGAMTFYVRTVSQTTGTYSDWTISQAAVEAKLNYSAVTVYAANGHGSTNNKVPRYQTVLENVGSAITYADSATAGASFTINEDGLYEIYVIATYSGGACNFGASKNSAQLTTAINGITTANQIIWAASTTSSNYNPVSRTIKCVAGDVIHPHGDGLPDVANATCLISVIKKESL